MYTLCRYFFIFMVYSIGGWLLETVMVLFRDGTFVKRGFLFGPITPIYGTAAVLLSLLFYGRINNVFLLFILCFFVCGVLEFLTHLVLEKLFHAMWWDYSGRRFNLQGRVYLVGLINFGLGGVIILKLIHPFVDKLTNALPPTALYIICLVMYSVLIADLALTVADLSKLIKGIKGSQYFIFSKLQKMLDTVKKRVKESKIVKKASASVNNENSLIKKIQKKYPKLSRENIQRCINIIVDKPQEGKARNDIKLYGTVETLPNPDEEESK